MEVLKFKPKARLLLQLGDQLIRNEAIAIFELIKNSYDAYARQVFVTFSDIDNPDVGRIEIKDDGDGMSLRTVMDVWMQPGTDNKKKLSETQKKYVPTDGEIFRLPLGEKGIGRFGVYKLGNSIEMVTRASQCDEVHLKIKWADIEQVDYLEDVTIDVEEREPSVFVGEKTGTLLIISGFRDKWNKRRFRETVRLINTLNTPSFIDIQSEKGVKDIFKVQIKENLGWANELISANDIVEKALFSGRIEIQGNYIKKFNYQFSPWKRMKGINERKYVATDIEMFKEIRDERTNKKTRKNITLDNYDIGTIRIFIYAYSLMPKILKLGVTDPSGFKKYIDENGGMRVYRDGLRIYDYGEKSNDWLSMDIRRVNQPGIYLSNNQFMGYVFIERSESGSLIEKSNREGFIENEAYFLFRDAVLFALRQFEIQRNIDKSTLQSFYSPKNYEEPVLTKLGGLKELVTQKVCDKELQTNIVQELSRIEEEYDEMMDTFLISANAGVNMGVAIHEIDKVVKELNIVLDDGKQIFRAQELAKRLTGLVNGYSMLLKEKKIQKQNIKTILNQAFFNVDFRLQIHEIQLETNIHQFKDDIFVECAKGITIGSVVNLIDNSIWWLEMRKAQIKKIYVGLEVLSNTVSVIVADSGSGFDIPVSAAVKPFISSKPTGTGMGLGLYIAKECMEEQGGELDFPEFQDLSLGDEYRNGAIVSLVFRR